MSNAERYEIRTEADGKFGVYDTWVSFITPAVRVETARKAKTQVARWTKELAEELAMRAGWSQAEKDRADRMDAAQRARAIAERDAAK